MKETEPTELRVRPRASETVSIEVPTEVLTALEETAASRDMSVPALVKLYLGQGLRADLARGFAEHVMETTAEVLARHVATDEAAIILREIQGQAASRR